MSRLQDFFDNLARNLSGKQAPWSAAFYNAQGYMGNFKEASLPYTPTFTANVDGLSDIVLSGVPKASVGVGWGLVYQVAENATYCTAPLLSDDVQFAGYATLDARIGLAAPDGRWRAQLYGRNITNTSFTTAVSSYLDTTIRYRCKPICYGASISFKY